MEVNTTKAVSLSDGAWEDWRIGSKLEAFVLSQIRKNKDAN